MMRCVLIRLTALTAGLLGMAPLGQATPITFSFTGTVTQLVTDPEDPFGGTIGFGTTFTGSYTFESTTPDAAPGTETGSYSMAGGALGGGVVIGGHAFNTGDFLSIGIADDFLGTVDQYSVLACAGGSASYLSTSSPGDLTIELFLEGPHTLFGSDGLPLTAPPLASFVTADFRLFANVGGNQVEIQGLVESLACTAGCGVVAPVPEASTTLFMSAGLAALAFGSRRRKRITDLSRISRSQLNP